MNNDIAKPVCDSIHQSGEIVELSAIIGGESNEYTREVAYTIHAQMGLRSVDNPAIKSAWAVLGKYRQGGEMIMLDPQSTNGNGSVFVVSYHPRDDYTITYAKLNEHNPRQAEIIDEREEIYCDQLCTLFTHLTGIDIPVVQFG